MELSKTFSFEASHMLPKHQGKCQRLHGHSWKLTVSVKGNINPETGFVIDYAELKAIVQPIIDGLDHRHLGAWDSDLNYNKKSAVVGLPEDFYPSSENLIMWVAGVIGSALDHGIHIPSWTCGGWYHYWSKLELNETCTSSCVLTREEYENTVRSR